MCVRTRARARVYVFWQCEQSGRAAAAEHVPERPQHVRQQPGPGATRPQPRPTPRVAYGTGTVLSLLPKPRLSLPHTC